MACGNQLICGIRAVRTGGVIQVTALFYGAPPAALCTYKIPTTKDRSSSEQNKFLTQITLVVVMTVVETWKVAQAP
jgi:hypothetical protein